MNKKLRYLVPVLVFAVIGVFLAIGLRIGPGYDASPLIGKKAPAFTLPSLQDPSVTVGTEDIAGKYALLNVWAEWCIECKYEHPFLMELARSGMPIYGLNWNDKRPRALGMIDNLGDPFIATGEDASGRVGIDYGVFGAPETFLIAPDLTILHRHAGPLNAAIWERDFVSAMEEHRRAQ